MRNRIILLAVIAAVATAVWAATLTVDVPPGAATANALVQCEALRIENRVLSANWSNDVCASVMTREGVRLVTETTARVARTNDISTCTSSANNTFQTTMNNFDTNWPFPVDTSECGDLAVDTEFGEDCDDGGESAACNDDCTTSVCGDGKLNTTDGEQCDDGNTDPGDGCNATCQNE